MTDHLFSPLRQRGVTLRNRIVVSPMCQYMAEDGRATDWHLAHLGARAMGGAGAVIAEATSVLPEGRISPTDLGLWNDDQVEPLARVMRFVAGQGAVPGVQLAHAGRKASTAAPWHGGGPLAAGAGGWPERVVGPSAVPFSPAHPVPVPLDEAAIGAVMTAFAAAARRAAAAGALICEVHAAHGYLLHQFLSPLSNRRTDGWGGTFAGRTRLLLQTVAAVREAWPADRPLWVRLSATDWMDEGWMLEESIALARKLKSLGVDLVDCSSGGSSPDARIPVGPGFQVPFADEIRRGAGVATGAVGLITQPDQADAIIRGGLADVVLMGRELLRRPQWPIEAAAALGQPAPVPAPYARAY